MLYYVFRTSRPPGGPVEEWPQPCNEAVWYEDSWWAIEIESVDALMRFAEEHGSVKISPPPRPVSRPGKMPILEICDEDGWRWQKEGEPDKRSASERRPSTEQAWVRR